jgi:hypothetical protein
LHLLSTYHCTEAARPFRPFGGTCADDQKSFNEFIRHQFQALIFGYLFIKKKVGASSVAMNRGKTARRAKASKVVEQRK